MVRVAEENGNFITDFSFVCPPKERSNSIPSQSATVSVQPSESMQHNLSAEEKGLFQGSSSKASSWGRVSLLLHFCGFPSFEEPFLIRLEKKKWLLKISGRIAKSRAKIRSSLSGVHKDSRNMELQSLYDWPYWNFHCRTGTVLILIIPLSFITLNGKESRRGLWLCRY